MNKVIRFPVLFLFFFSLISFIIYLLIFIIIGDEKMSRFLWFNVYFLIDNVTITIQLLEDIQLFHENALCNYKTMKIGEQRQTFIIVFIKIYSPFYSFINE